MRIRIAEYFPAIGYADCTGVIGCRVDGEFEASVTSSFEPYPFEGVNTGRQSSLTVTAFKLME